MELKLAPFDLGAVLAQLHNIFVIQVEQKHLSLEFDTHLESQIFFGDKMRLSQVLTNLLSNAYKFTAEGGRITLSIREEKREDDHARLLFSVKDTGIGIEPKDQERIFRSFEQVGAGNNKMPGTGLGLSISRNLVQLMGGTLQVESTVGEGAAFYFSLDLPVSHVVLEEEAPSQPEPEVSMEGLLVLLAEDNDINAEIAIELLALKKVTVERAADGQQAVTLFSEHPEGYYRLILMDLNMPIMDGLTATKKIRGMDRADASSIPILAMTANTFQEDRDQAMAAGMNGFLPKPFSVDQLYDILRCAL